MHLDNMGSVQATGGLRFSTGDVAVGVLLHERGGGVGRIGGAVAVDPATSGKSQLEKP